MKRDLFTVYECAPDDDIDLDGLAELGITIKPPAGTCCIWPDNTGTWWKELGHIVVWDDTKRIDATPYGHTDSQDRSYLAAVAFNAWLDAPTAEKEWGHTTSKTGRGYWHQVVYAEVRTDDTETVRIFASAESHRERTDRALGFGSAE